MLSRISSAQSEPGGINSAFLGLLRHLAEVSGFMDFLYHKHKKREVTVTGW